MLDHLDEVVEANRKFELKPITNINDSAILDPSGTTIQTVVQGVKKTTWLKNHALNVFHRNNIVRNVLFLMKKKKLQNAVILKIVVIHGQKIMIMLINFVVKNVKISIQKILFFLL